MRYGIGARIFYDTLAQSLLLEAGPSSAVQLVVPKDNSPPKEDCLAVSQALAGRNTEMLDDPRIVHSATNGQAPLPDNPFVLDCTDDNHSTIAARYRSVLGSRADVVVLVEHDVPQLGCRVIPFDLDSRHLFEGVTEAFGRIVSEAAHKGNVLELPSRFLTQGLRGIQAQFSIFEESPHQRVSNDYEVRRFCDAICRTWTYCGSRIAGNTVYNWVQQFQPYGVTLEALALLEYLNRDGFIPKYEVVQRLEALHSSLVCDSAEVVTPVSIQRVGKSEAMLLYDIRSVSTVDVFQKAKEAHGQAHLVCFDDVVGSGNTILECLFPDSVSEGKTNLQEWLTVEGRFVTVLAALGSDKGIAAIEGDGRANGRVRVRVSRKLTPGESIFSVGQGIFLSEERGEMFREVCEEIGGNLECWGAFGWENLGWCIVTDYNVPDCTLPILWAEGRGDFSWTPLFPRR